MRPDLEETLIGVVINLGNTDRRVGNETRQFLRTYAKDLTPNERAQTARLVRAINVYDGAVDDTKPVAEGNVFGQLAQVLGASEMARSSRR